MPDLAEIDITRPSVQPPEDVTAAPTAPVLPPSGPAVAPAPALQEPAYSPSGVMMEQLRQRYANLPMDQANEAVSAALKFQAIRGYQRELELGTSPQEALTKWAPVMFTAPHSSTLGQAASMVRAAGAGRRVINAGGQLFDVNTGRGTAPSTVTALTPPEPVRVPTSPLVVNKHRNLLAQAQALEKKLDDEPSGPDADNNRSKLQYVRQQISALEAENTPARATVSPPAGAQPIAATAPAAGQTVIRRTHDGRRAVFDAATRRFIKYAE